MVALDHYTENKLKNTFNKVKEDINNLKNELEQHKTLILNQNNQITSLKEEIIILKQNISNLIKIIGKYSSIGNKGVFRQTDNRQTTDTFSTDFRQIPIIIDPIKKKIENTFKSLTNKEFIVFITIYQLEEELKAPVTYSDLAKRLKLSQSSIRDHVNELILKEAPIEKIRMNNKKVSLFINKDFKNLNLAQKLLSFRQQYDQTTLFNNI